MDRCSTPALNDNHLDVWPFSSPLWNLLLKKLSIGRNKESETQTDLSLNTSPSCQTLSKALYISGKTPRVSRVG